MTPTDDEVQALVERLTAVAPYVEQAPPVHYESEAASAIRLAAAMLSTLRAENDRLREALAAAALGGDPSSPSTS